MPLNIYECCSGIPVSNFVTKNFLEDINDNLFNGVIWPGAELYIMYEVGYLVEMGSNYLIHDFRDH
jgi:hypothetical protein